MLERWLGKRIEPTMRNKWEVQKVQLLSILDTKADSIMQQINDAAGEDSTHISIDAACDTETAALIRQVFVEKNTHLITHLRSWCRDTLQCNLQEKDDVLFFDWDDTSLLKSMTKSRENVHGRTLGGDPSYGDET